MDKIYRPPVYASPFSLGGQGMMDSIKARAQYNQRGNYDMPQEGDYRRLLMSLPFAKQMYEGK